MTDEVTSGDGKMLCKMLVYTVLIRRFGCPNLFFSFGLMFLICKAYSSAYGCKKDIMLQRSNFKSLEKCTCDGKAVSRLSGELELLLMYGSNR